MRTGSFAIGRASDAGAVALARDLFQRYAQSLPFDLAYQNFESELAGLPEPYAPPHGALLLARQAGVAIAVVGVKPLAEGIAEIKRLYVAPEARGQRLGRAMLHRALAVARQIGYARVRLDSHRPTMGRAIALYRALGFVEIPPYGPDPAGEFAFFEKRLRPRAESAATPPQKVANAR